MSALVPVGPNVPEAIQAILRSHEQAILELQQAGHPTRLVSIATKAALSLDPNKPASWPECAAICDEINSVVVSTKVAGVYTWLRADGGAI